MLITITEDVAKFFYEYAPRGCLAATVVVFCSILFAMYLRKCFVLPVSLENALSGRMFVGKLLLIFVFTLYAYIVIGITILSRSESVTREVSFQLFRTFQNTFSARKQIYENIVMFVPYAVLLYGLAEPFRKLRVVVLVGLGSSLLIEVMQWVTWTGYFEVDDILTNTFGMLSGYVICVVIGKVESKIENRHGV